MSVKTKKLRRSQVSDANQGVIASPDPGRDHYVAETHSMSVSPKLRGNQKHREDHSRRVSSNNGGVHAVGENQSGFDSSNGRVHTVLGAQKLHGSADLQSIADQLAPAYAELRQAAEMFSDHQKRRIAIGNQIGSLQVQVARYAWYREQQEYDEKELSKLLVRLYRQVASVGVIEWQRSTSGIGEHELARFLGALGHPRLAIPKLWARNTDIADNEFGDEENPKRMLVAGEPFLRTFGQLRQYCGIGAPVHRVKGMTQEEAFALGRPACKAQLWRIVASVVKAQVRSKPEAHALGPLGQLYLDTKADYATRTHSGPCPGGYVTARAGGVQRVIRVRCKVDGRYAVEGDPFQPSHVDAIARRRVAKKVLGGLFDAAVEPWCS